MQKKRFSDYKGAIITEIVINHGENSKVQSLKDANSLGTAFDPNTAECKIGCTFLQMSYIEPGSGEFIGALVDKDDYLTYVPNRMMIRLDQPQHFPFR